MNEAGRAYSSQMREDLGEGRSTSAEDIAIGLDEALGKVIVSVEIKIFPKLMQLPYV